MAVCGLSMLVLDTLVVILLLSVWLSIGISISTGSCPSEQSPNSIYDRINPCPREYLHSLNGVGSPRIAHRQPAPISIHIPSDKKPIRNLERKISIAQDRRNGRAIGRWMLPKVEVELQLGHAMQNGSIC